jgi:FkbM family methyltransferase
MTFKFLNVAAWTSDGTLTYSHEFAAGKSDGRELSSRLTPGETRGNTETVPTLDLGKFIREEIQGANRTIVVKMDIEGAEYEVMPWLVATGAVCNLDVIAVEWHGGDRRRKEIDPVLAVLKAAKCPMEILDLDDESYHQSKFPLPA